MSKRKEMQKCVAFKIYLQDTNMLITTAITHLELQNVVKEKNM